MSLELKRIENMNLSNKKILVTGGTSGIGEATIKELIRNGAKVAFCGRNVERGNKIIQDLKESKSNLKFVRADMTCEKEIENFFYETKEFLGEINCAFNNAGIEGEIANFNESTKENWENVLNTNLNSTWLMMKKEINHMLEIGEGNIVNMASTSGLVGNGFGLSAYAASKFAIIGLSKSVALEYAKSNIRVNTICPGFVETPMVDRICDNYKSMRRRFVACHPIGRLGNPEEIANAVAYLFSDKSAFMTGHNLVLDGGLTI